MAVTSTIKRNSVYLLLDSGETLASGAAKTLSVSLGSLSTTALDQDKAMNIVNALIPCFMYSYSGTQHMVTSTLRASN